MSSWKQALAAIAPTIATAVGGPFGGMAAKFALEKLGFDAPPQPDKAEKKLEQVVKAATPEQIVQLKQIDADFEIRLEELGLERETLYVKDTQHARGLARLDMRPQITLSGIYTFGYFGLIGSLVFGVATIPDGEAGHLLSGLIGVLTAMQLKIGDFWFGSSHGSKNKSHKEQ